MSPRPLAWALVLLGAALAVALALGSAPAPGAREKLCGHHFVRALVSCCSGWKDDISMGRCPMGTPCWFSFHRPCPRPLSITTTGEQLPPIPHTTAASAAAHDRTC
uniref:Insulin-like factor 3 n=1 Tax=Canis lupus familiaris TaxID=9615 RepID=Q6X7V2_CANLF|nr:insulin-like factor 3 [Canis lupus familiaris]